MKKTIKKLIFLAGCTLFITGCSSHSSSEGSTYPQNENAGAPVTPPNGSPVALLPGAVPGGTLTTFKLNCNEAQFVHLLNIYRRSSGLQAVNVSKNGVLAARWHAQDMNEKNYFSHTEPSGRTFSVRTASFGYTARSENIAAGSVSASATFCQWKNSSGHNLNMLNANHQSTGIGQVSGLGDYRSYWSNSFGGKAPDELAEPLTLDENCKMPLSIPTC